MTLQYGVSPGIECDKILSSIEYPSEGRVVVGVLTTQ
jgi:hypothetical protein